MNKETGEQGRGILEYVRELLLGAVSGLLLSMVLLLLISILMSSGTLDEDHISVFVYGSAALGALLGALTTSKRVTSHKLPGALGVGVVMYLLIVIFGVLFDLRYGNGGWQMPMAILIAALAGGLIGGSGKRRKSKRVIQNRGKRKGK